MKIGYLMQAGVPDPRRQPPSGPANHTIQVFRELQKCGDQLVLLVRLENHLWTSRDLTAFDLVEVPILDRGLVRLFERVVRRVQSTLHLPYAELFDSLRFAFACSKLFKGYDLLYERMGWFGYGGAIASKLLKIPLILEVNGDHVSELAMKGYKVKGPQHWLSTILMSLAVRQSSLIVAAGEGWKKRFIERWKVDPAKVVVVENGTDVVGLLAREDLRSFQSASNLEKINILYVGGFEPWHGIDVLIEAFRKLINSGISAQLQLIGSGVEQAKLETLVQESGISDKVTFTGFLTTTEMAACLAQADIGVSPYCGRVEFSGLKLLDYKAAGLPTVASGMDGQPSVILDGQTGFTVPPCDVNALYKALHKLSIDSERRKSMGRKAREEAELFHTWQQTAQRLRAELSGLEEKFKRTSF